MRSRSPPAGRRHRSKSRSRSPRRRSRSRSGSPKRRAPVGLTFSKGLLESVNKGASWDDKAAAFLEKIGAAPSAKMAFGSSTNGSGTVEIPQLSGSFSSCLLTLKMAILLETNFNFAQV